MTCLRDPLKRCASNFNYAYYSGYTDARSMGEFASEPNVHMSDNYYTRMFSRKEQLPLVGVDYCRNWVGTGLEPLSNI